MSVTNQMAPTVLSCRGNHTIPHCQPTMTSVRRGDGPLSTTLHRHQNCFRRITTQLKRGIIEKVPTITDNPNTTHYIPHHCVKKNSITTPIQIVYDCSCQQSCHHPSLNDCLLTGPHFLNDLCSILLRFRSHNYATSTDIEKAFLHVTLHETDRDYTWFFWLKDVADPKGQFEVYRFK